MNELWWVNTESRMKTLKNKYPLRNFGVFRWLPILWDKSKKKKVLIFNEMNSEKRKKRKYEKRRCFESHSLDGKCCAGGLSKRYPCLAKAFKSPFKPRTDSSYENFVRSNTRISIILSITFPILLGKFIVILVNTWRFFSLFYFYLIFPKREKIFKPFFLLLLPLPSTLKFLLFLLNVLTIIRKIKYYRLH